MTEKEFLEKYSKEQMDTKTADAILKVSDMLNELVKRSLSADEEETEKLADDFFKTATPYFENKFVYSFFRAILSHFNNIGILEDALTDRGKEAKGLLPFILDELEATDIAEMGDSLPDVLDAIDGRGDLSKNKWAPIIERAQFAKEKANPAQKKAPVLHVTTKPAESVNYPLDKPNSVIWNLLTTADPDGQLALDIVTSKSCSEQDAVIYYGINFDELEKGLTITKQLTPFDKRVYIAAAALFNAGNETVSIRQIYKSMGNIGEPPMRDIQKINDSLTKMSAARVYLDNIKEITEMKGYKHFKYDASLLPFERVSAYVNGQLTESAIHFFREPPLISFAKKRKQITTFPRKVLESPVNKTDANLMIDDYLLERIGRMKDDKGNTPRKMLYDTIFKQCQIKTAKQKQRAPEKIKRYLDFYKKVGHIKDYAEEADGLTIIL